MKAIRPKRAATEPSWDRLFELASEQSGCFTTKQAASVGYSTQLLWKHMRAGRVARVQHGIYRLVHFPATEHDELAVIWLWSAQAGVFSHRTALSLHDLSDVLPSRVHLTLPAPWRSRRLRVPDGVTLHHADIPARERTWFGAVPVTSVARTLDDCAADGLSPELLRQAALQALDRGLVTQRDLRRVLASLAPFGGLAG